MVQNYLNVELIMAREKMVIPVFFFFFGEMIKQCKSAVAETVSRLEMKTCTCKIMNRIAE